ncbi:HNH endonuclease signature motif containing protein [Clostridium sp.]|uniref:HNH endonuclease n=1 Tax=Clostridium sp. TaxID=1506 RepID=UPI001DFF0F31|nr:HNH endonuclease signature motif containing protein [Clostridium sp.]MBS5937735.1 HNH endonuclease [Clostridium sp.]
MCIGVECKICEDFYGVWYVKGNGADAFPAIYGEYYDVMMDLGILCQMKKDFLLLEYLERNEKLYKMNFCYLDMAHYIVDDVYLRSNKFYECRYKNIVEFVVDHLYYAFGSAYDEDNELKKRYDYLRENEIKEKYRKSPVNIRIGQEKYRKDLIYIYKTCQLCGMANEELLIASHIKDYSKSNINECIDFENGLLLCRNHDGLFDRGLISFNDEGNIIISNFLSESDIYKLNIIDKKIDLSKKQKEYMRWHRENKFKNK